MFMRYRGGGVGHLYMRTIEHWLAETGWGSNDTLISTDVDSEEDSKGSDDSKDSDDGGSEDEVPQGDTTSNGTTDSDEERGSEVDPDAEYMSSENNEETIDGEYGFSGI